MTDPHILFIAPLPPPLTGHSIADKVLLDEIKERFRVDVIDLSVESRHDGTISFRRILAVINVLGKIRVASKTTDIAYLTIAESIAGNLKDLLILWLLRGRVERIVLHLHGGSFRVTVLERSWLLRKWNKALLSKVNRIVVTGNSHKKIFRDVVVQDRLSVVPNFALPQLFTTPDKIRRKFTEFGRIRVLYVSGMDRRKGYERLLDAYLALPQQIRSRLQLDFAGRFDDPREQEVFVEHIAKFEDISYHGMVDGERKRHLFAQAHLFCLPTSYLEGQPLSILEAYASGCVVLTTPQPGILDVFKPGRNGELISTEDPKLLKENLIAFSAEPERSLIVALNNFDQAEKNYRADTFCERMISILENN